MTYSIGDTWTDTSAYITRQMDGFTNGDPSLLNDETGESIITHSAEIGEPWPVTADEMQRWLDEEREEYIAQATKGQGA